LQSGRVFIFQRSPQGDQAARVVEMVVGQDDGIDRAQVDAELGRVLEHRVRALTGVEEHGMPVGLDERRVTPLAHAAKLGEHGG
jgi:hypothetical protein